MIDERRHAAGGFRHEAMLYAGEEDFVRRAAAFVRAGLAAGEPVFVILSARKLEALRRALGPDAERVQFADMAEVGRNPSRIIPAWQEFVASHGPGARVRGIGEPVYAARSPEELSECQLHERLLNVAFAGAEAFILLCPYDTTSLPPSVIEEARRSHPLLASAHGDRPSDSYEGEGGLAASLGAPLPPFPRGAAELRLRGGEADAARRFVAQHAAGAGLGMRRRIDLIVAAGAVAADALAGGGGVVRLWTPPGRVVCEIRGRRELADPLADRCLSPSGAEEPTGLLVANRLCDLVQVRRTPSGTVARLHVSAR